MFALAAVIQNSKFLLLILNLHQHGIVVAGGAERALSERCLAGSLRALQLGLLGSSLCPVHVGEESVAVNLEVGREEHVVNAGSGGVFGMEIVERTVLAEAVASLQI